MELLSKLGIDWKLLLAQVVNFAILLGILTLFVYRPLLTLIDARRERIRKSLQEAERIERQAQEMEKLRAEHLRKIDAEAGAFLERAKKQAEEMKKDILVAAEKEATQILARGREQLAAERAAVTSEVQGALVAMIMRMTEKILQREFSSADQERIVAAVMNDLPRHLR